MGIGLSFLLFDATDDAPASQLLRAFDAVCAWAPGGPFVLERDVLAPHDALDAMVRRAGIGRTIGHDPPRLPTRDEVRAAITAFERPEWLVIGARCPVPSGVRISLRSVARHWPHCPSGSTEHAVRRGRMGDVQLDMDTVGRRFFEQPNAYSDDAERLAAEIEAEHVAGRRWRVELLRREAAELTARNAVQRREIALSMYETIAPAFGTTSMRAHVESHDAIAPLSSLIYYRDTRALRDDIALLADTAEHSDHASAAQVLDYALQPPARDRSPYPLRAIAQEKVAPILARLRAVDLDELARAVAVSPLASPLGEGFVLSNAAFSPVGDTVASFFASLLA